MCEKPLALNYVQASEMAATARKKGVITCVPFTYRYMPSTRYLKQLIDEGYLGRPYHLHMRYYASFDRDPQTYLWRFERKIASSGALVDIGSHFLHVSEWFYGEIEAVTAQLSALVKRPPNPLRRQGLRLRSGSRMGFSRLRRHAAAGHPLGILATDYC